MGLVAVEEEYCHIGGCEGDCAGRRQWQSNRPENCNFHIVVGQTATIGVRKYKRFMIKAFQEALRVAPPLNGGVWNGMIIVSSKLNQKP